MRYSYAGANHRSPVVGDEGGVVKLEDDVIFTPFTFPALMLDWSVMLAATCVCADGVNVEGLPEMSGCRQQNPGRSADRS
jgi:hypothetical protein